MTDKVLLCAIAKQENKYIKEWVDYHLNLGFDHITIYDNNDTGGERISDALSNDMRVDIVDFRGKKQKSCETQVEAYNHCYKNAKNYTWVLFIDIDEFLWFRDYDNIKVFLAQNWVRKANVIRFHWKCYSDNDQLHYEDRPVMERFTQPCSNVEVNYHTKQMYRTNLGTLRIVNVHYSTNVAYIFYPDGKPAPYTTSTKDSSIHDELAHVKHYVTKSLEEYVRIKWARRCEGSSKTRLSMDFYFKYNKRTDEKVRYYRQLMNELKNAKAPTTMIKKSTSTSEPYMAMALCPGAKTRPAKPVTESAKIAPNSAYNPKDDKVYPFGVSVCISAWKTAEYIEECLDSVAAQTWFKDHDNYEILLGIDCCEETLAKVKEIMHKYKNLKVMMMDKNVGTYVTCNTIMKEAKYEWLLRFDSDDVMYPNMVEELMRFRKPIQPCFVQYQYCDFVGNFQNKRNSSINARGSVFYSKSIFEKYGGYKNWRCAADFEMLERLKKFVSYYAINKPLFYRRKHNNNLTSNVDTGMKSEYRAQLHKQIHSPLNENDAIIVCETQTYKKITISPLVSFLIVNRGGTELKKVIDNINNSFNCEKEIIIINQEDTDFFKRGQLFNIGYKYSSGEYLVLMDNDIIILHPFDIVKKYNEINKAYLPFTKVSQLTYKTDTNYSITKTELRPSGFGAFAVVKKNDFIKSNGFSNLCMNWGAEDNIFNIKIGGFYRIDDNIGHITHPSRSTSITEKHRSINYEAYVLYNNKKIKNECDGYQQTTFDLVYDKIENGVRYLGIKNISVINNYAYKKILQKHYE